MSEDREREKKSFGERVEELWQEVVEALESLVVPQPELIPVRVRPRGPRRRR